MFPPVDGDALTAALVDVERRQVELDRERVGLIARWDQQQAWANDGSASAAARLARETRLSGALARERVKVARLLASSMPATAAAFGELGWSKVRLLANAIDERTADAFAACEAALVEHAVGLSVDQLAVFLGHWRRLVDEDGANRDADAMHDQQFLQVATSWAGEGFVKGRFDPETTAIFKAALDRIAEELYRAEARERQVATLRGEEPAPMRSASHRNALAAREMAKRAMATTAAVEDGHATAPARPSVHVVIEADERDHLLARFATGPSIPLGDAARLACDAVVARVVTKDGVVPLELGRAVRDPSDAQRRALSAIWSMCAYPGCDRPFAWCDLHHVIHWEDGGPTDVGWLIPQCDHHHTKHHQGVFRIGRRPDGTFWFERADGTFIGEANPTLNKLFFSVVHLAPAAA